MEIKTMKNYYTFISIFITLNVFSQPTWKVSGAPIGDTSTYLYPVGGWLSGTSLTITDASGNGNNGTVH